jgi:hypothetical protein
MAYTTYGKKVYASIQDLPQYTNIINGDKIIIWNETREGAAVVDYADFIIDLEHTTFKSTISEIINLAGSIEAFTYKVEEEITSIKESIEKLQASVDDELLSRIKSLEYILAIILGANTYWGTSNGLETIRNKFLIDGIDELQTSEEAEYESESAKKAFRWYKGFMTTVRSYISKVAPTDEDDNVLLQSRFNYRSVSVNSGSSDSASAVQSLTRGATQIVTTKNESGGTTTTIKYNVTDDKLS